MCMCVSYLFLDEVEVEEAEDIVDEPDYGVGGAPLVLVHVEEGDEDHQGRAAW